MQRNTIPTNVIYSVANALGSFFYSHNRLNLLFAEAGAPGDAPQGNCIDKCEAWLKRCNEDPAVDPFQILGALISEFEARNNESNEWNSCHQRINDALRKANLMWTEDGKVIHLNSKPVFSAPLKVEQKAVPPSNQSPMTTPSVNQKPCVFIGHGGSQVWRELKDFISDRLHLNWTEFNREPAAGIPTIDKLSELLKTADFAFIIMTAEDEQADGSLRARENAVHEAGLFQGKLGFRKCIVLLENGCNEFSNIHGLGQIRFPKNQIGSTFEEIRRVLEREQAIK